MGPFPILLLALCATDVALAIKTLSIGPIGEGHAVTKRDVEPVAYKVNIHKLHVESRIEYRFATTRISSKIANAANVSQEVLFSVVIPETAFISGFKMEVDDKVYEAYVKEKEAAKQEYTHAVARGQGAAHISASSRDSNHFTVSVNVEPMKKVTFNLTYDELLKRRMGTYNLAINIDPGKVVREMSINVHIKENRNITVLRVPELRSGNEVDADDTTRVNDLASITRTSPTEAHVSFSPTSEQQKTLGHIGSGLPKRTLKGQFVVQYDVDRDSEAGEVLVTDGYFVHFYAPKNLPPLRKHAIFLLDVSGSMSYRKLDQLKEAMATILDNLNEGDYFNIIEFSTGVKVWNLDSWSESYTLGWTDRAWRWREVENRTPTPAFPATNGYITAAKRYVSAMSTFGSTNMYDGLKTAIHVAHVGLENVTDNSAEEKPQPIIFFLTDGQPTGKGTKEIEAMVQEENRNPPVAIFSLAFGNDADFEFLKKLSLRNSGFAKKIYEASDAALQLRDFYRQIASPLLANVTFNYQPDKTVEGTTTRTQFPALFSGSEIVVAGKIPEETLEMTSDYYFDGQIDGVSKSGARNTILHMMPPHLYPRPAVIVNRTVTPIEKLWAYLTIKQLLEDQEALTDDVTENQTRNQKALELALKYSFVTPLTSLVVVKPNDTEDLGTQVEREAERGDGYRQWDQPPVHSSVLSLQPQPYMTSYFRTDPQPNLQMQLQHIPDVLPRSIIRPSRVRSSSSFSAHSRRDSPPQQQPTFYTAQDDPESDQKSDVQTVTGTEGVNNHSISPNANSGPEAPSLSRMDDLKWLEGVRNGSEVTLPFGPAGENETYPLQLTPDTDTLLTPCEVKQVGWSTIGFCNHLIDCPLKIFETEIQLYSKFFCTLNNYAGVCCPVSIRRDNHRGYILPTSPNHH